MHDQGTRRLFWAKFMTALKARPRETRFWTPWPKAPPPPILSPQALPPLCVRRPARGFGRPDCPKILQSGGDIRQTLRTIFLFQEFLSPRYYRAKIKSPLGSWPARFGPRIVG